MRAVPYLFSCLAAGAVIAAPKPPVKPAKPAAKPAVKGAKVAPKKLTPAQIAKLKAPPRLPSRGGLTPLRVVPIRQVNEKQPASQIPMTMPAVVPTTIFQTNVAYDPRIDLKTDGVAVHGHGASWQDIDAAIQSWKKAGYPVHRMFFIGSDAGRIYVEGKADGTPHPGDIETDLSGRAITVGDRPYMVPTTGWLSYLKEHIRRAIDSGAEGIWPEEPLMHASGGYSPAFQSAWQELYHTPWQAPHGSPSTFFKASRVKSDLYLRAVDELLRYTKEYAKQNGRDVKFLLPVHSPVSYAAWNLVFPHAAASRLPIDGLIAQVWTGPARTPATYEGKTEPQFFESSWMMYSYFANLMDGLKKPLYFLADPVEDDPNYGWAQYEKWYRSVLAASLFFPQPTGYEVMPWPDRIYLPGYKMGEGTPGPAPYLSDLSSIISALKEIPAQPSTYITRKVGVVTLDTMMWQRGGPSGSSMRSLHGLALPLLKRGVPVEIVPGERVSDPGYLSKFKVLLVSYDMQKPLGPEVSQGLGDWVKAGGALIVFGGEDAYNDIGEWWTRDGYPGPTEHLLRVCGVNADVSQRTVRNGTSRYADAAQADGPFRSLENRKIVSIPLASYNAGGKPVYVRFSDRYPEDAWGAWLGKVRVTEGGRVRAEFTAGTAGEQPFLVENTGSQAAMDARYADGDTSFVYRFSHLGPDAVLELDLGNQYRVGVATGDDPAVTLQSTTAGGGSVRVASNYPVVQYALGTAEPLYRSGSTQDAPVWSSPAGAGLVVYCGLPAAFGADSPQGADLVRSLTKYACAREGVAWTEGPIQIQRGPYLIAHALGNAVELKGRYIDLFNPELPLVENPRLPYRDPAFLKQVQLSSRIPTLLHGTNRIRVLEATVARMRLRLDGPEGTQGVLRIFPAGMSVAGVDAADTTGKRVNVDLTIEEPTVRVRYPQSAAGLNLTIRWIRPEERLTK